MQVQVKVSKEMHELGLGVAAFVAAVKTALDDGFQYGDDIPDIISSAIGDLLPSLTGIDNIGLEYKEDPEAFFKTLALMGVDVAKALGVVKGA